MLVQKRAKLSLPGRILNWLINFLSIVQGSGLEPSFYIVLASDLKPIFNVSLISSYADDTNVLVREHTDVQLYYDFGAIKNCAVNNRMIINYSKTKEIVFHGLNPCMEIAVSPSPAVLPKIHLICKIISGGVMSLDT